jgi:hypothetical protein
MTSAADFTISRYGRGACPVCGRDISLTRKGGVRVHSAQAKGVWPPMNCNGSGHLPAEVTSNAD